jgi:phage replication O-like protein O
MASPQIENGYTRIANEIMEALAKIRIPGEARQVLDAVFRKTYGWNKREDKISLSQFEKMTGLARPSICRAIKKLLIMNIIEKSGNSKSLFTKRGNDKISVYSIQKNHNDWLTLTKTLTLINQNANVKHANKRVNRTLTKELHTIDTIQKKLFSPNSDEFRMSELLFNLIQERNPNHKKPDMQKWALHIDNMIRLDNRSVEDIEKIIRWCQENEFWQNNILSTSRLKKQYDTLWLKSDLNRKQNFKRFDEQGF